MIFLLFIKYAPLYFFDNAVYSADLENLIDLFSGVFDVHRRAARFQPLIPAEQHAQTAAVHKRQMREIQNEVGLLVFLYDFVQAAFGDIRGVMIELAIQRGGGGVVLMSCSDVHRKHPFFRF